MADASVDPERLTPLRNRILPCALLQIAVALLVAFASPRPLAWLGGQFGLIFIFALLTAAILSGLVRWLFEGRRGEAPFVGPWAMVMRAKLVFHLALLCSLPVLALTLFLAWLIGGLAGEIGRALIELLVGGTVVGITGSLAGNLLNLIAPRPRPA